MLFYSILFCTVLYYTILYYTIIYYTILYYTTLHYTILYYTILYYTILYYTILYYVSQDFVCLLCAITCWSFGEILRRLSFPPVNLQQQLRRFAETTSPHKNCAETSIEGSDHNFTNYKFKQKLICRTNHQHNNLNPSTFEQSRVALKLELGKL